jgi:hypothetical protein
LSPSTWHLPPYASLDRIIRDVGALATGAYDQLDPEIVAQLLHEDLSPYSSSIGTWRRGARRSVHGMRVVRVS